MGDTKDGKRDGYNGGSLGTFRGRIKALSQKNLAFVAIALSVLVASPVAEHLLSAPRSGISELKAGFGYRRGGAEGSVYEPGINALTNGSPDGSGEIITPLSLRDPASLIIGISPRQLTGTMSAPRPSNIRNRIREMASESMARAVKAAGTPAVIPKMQTAFRGISSLFGNGSTHSKGGIPGGARVLASARSASGKTAARSMVGPVGGPDYKGVASSRNSADRGAFEKLRGAAERASGNFSGGSGAGSLKKAAGESMFARPGHGGVTAHPGEQFGRPPDSSIKNPRKISGEPLAQRAARIRMQKALEWEFYVKYEIPKKVAGALIDYVGAELRYAGKDGKKERTEADALMQGKGYFCHRDSPRDVIPFEFCNAKKLNCGGCKCGLNQDPHNPPPGVCAGKSGKPVSARKDPGPSDSLSKSMTPESAQALNEKSAVFGDYDQTLEQMYVAVLDGGRTQDPAEQLKYALELAGAFTSLRADLAADRIKAGANKTGQEAIAPFDEGIEWAVQSAAGIQKDMRLDIVDLKALQVYSAAAAAARLDYFREISAFYKKQLELVKHSADQVSQDYAGKVLPAAENIRNELTPLMNKARNRRPLTNEEKDLIALDFERLCGEEFFKKALLWRGADIGYAGGEVTVDQTLNDEIAAWNELDPSLKYANAMEPLGEGEPAESNLFAAFIRGYCGVLGQGGEIYTSARKLINGDDINVVNLGVIRDFQPAANRYAAHAADTVQNHIEE